MANPERTGGNGRAREDGDRRPGEELLADADGSPRRELPLVADRMVSSEHQVAAGKPSVAAGWDLPADLDKDPGEIPELAETEVPEHLKAEIEASIVKYPDHHAAVMPALQAAQRHHGYLSRTAMRQVAAVMKVTPAYLSSVASFYDMLHEEPGRTHYVYVCTSVSCHVQHAHRVFRAIAEAARVLGLENWEVREFECLGACDMAPMASVDGRYIGPLDVADAPEIVFAIKEGRTPLPDRGLEDEDYRPAGAGDPPPHGELAEEEGR
ncbi:MAG: NAD(P)H-dependent oxidoreductase subunit E [Actinomycetota bacterium]|nr:NAD(P)H-dependent oxidoreductase subunit E [Actinomycetota bacterium]